MAKPTETIDTSNRIDNRQGREAEPSLIGGAASVATLAFLSVASMFSRVWDGITRDGTLEAAARQGVDELGLALKAFPDSIQVEEPGTIWHPTQGEIAASRNDHGWDRGNYTHYSNLTPPPRAERENGQDGHQPQRSYDNGREHDDGYSM